MPVLDRFLDALFPLSCPSCGTTGRSPCGPCRSELRAPPALAVPDGLRHWAAAYAYAGAARNIALAVKRSHQHALTQFMADAIVTRTAPALLDVDVVTWVPTTADRIHRRGYDHAEVLARRLAKQLWLPCRGLVDRVTGPMDHASGRHATVSFVARYEIDGRVLLIDDVRTTGQTLTAVATALGSAGAKEISARTFAATDPPSVGS
jgi:predicted amidophosphoribosyltransferase